MPVGYPPQEKDDAVGERPNELMMDLRDQALKQHPEWLEEVDLTPLSFAHMMLHYPARLELFKQHPQVKNFLKDRVLVDTDTALQIAIKTNNLAMVRWLIEEVKVNITQTALYYGPFITRGCSDYGGNPKKIDAVQLAIQQRRGAIVAYLAERKETPLQTADGVNDYLVEAIKHDADIANIFLDARPHLPHLYLGRALSEAACYSDNPVLIQRLLKEGADPNNALGIAIDTRDIDSILTLISSPACKIETAHIQQAQNRLNSARYCDGTGYCEEYYDEITPSRAIKYAVLFCDSTQRAISGLAKHNAGHSIDKNKVENIDIIKDLIDAIERIDLPVTCCLKYLSRMIDAIKASQLRYAAIADGVTFFAECYVRRDQKSEHKEAHWSRGLLSKDMKKEVVRSCFNLFFKTSIAKKRKTLIRDELYKGLDEDLKSLDANDQIVLKKKAVTLGYSMFVLASNGSGGEGTRGGAMKREVDQYEMRHGKLLV